MTYHSFIDSGISYNDMLLEETHKTLIPIPTPPIPKPPIPKPPDMSIGCHCRGFGLEGISYKTYGEFKYASYPPPHVVIGALWETDMPV